MTRLILCCGTGDHGMLVRRNPEVFRPILDREAPVAELASVLGSMLLPLDQRGNTSFNRAFLSVIRDSFVRHEEGIRSQQKALAACPPAMSALNEISVPVLVIMGDRDGLIPPREGENLARPAGRPAQILSRESNALFSQTLPLRIFPCSKRDPHSPPFFCLLFCLKYYYSPFIAFESALFIKSARFFTWFPRIRHPVLS